MVELLLGLELVYVLPNLVDHHRFAGFVPQLGIRARTVHHIKRPDQILPNLPEVYVGVTVIGFTAPPEVGVLESVAVNPNRGELASDGVRLVLCQAVGARGVVELLAEFAHHDGKQSRLRLILLFATVEERIHSK